jgi:N-hydroxyarylamine O-acetyltransferase
VRAEGAEWHADVGFGRGTLLEPIPFGPGATHEQSGWRFRVVEDGPELVLQTAQDGQWVDLYGFVPEPVPFIDIETSNWFTCTHPRSPFVTGLIVSVQRPDGTRVSLSDWEGLSLDEETPTRRLVRAVDPSEVAGLIATRFGLDGFDG